ncbi:MAG TPA: sigma-70 family RNA polymerase sigma factor [Phycisphaerae bacterium]|nr:sigma-70 family RNA polymerase sigma factor [Phycisphaerae bacterium]
MAQYHHKQMAELAHQMQLSPVRLRLKQFEAAEYLIDLLEPEKEYPYDFVCHHLTGYRPKSNAPYKSMPGASLIEDLVQLIEDLSSATVLPAGAMRTTCWTTEELAQRLGVSTKTICRWRRRGLPGRKLRYPDGTVRTAFLERSVRRFVARNHDMVRRGAAFKQLTTAEKARIVQRAKEILAEKRMRLHELSQLIAAEMNRAVETVRYTLRRWDQAHPDEAMFGKDDQPAIRPELRDVFEAIAGGESPESVARRLGRSVESIRRDVREYRARTLKSTPIEYIYNREFDAPGADTVILGATERPDKSPAPRQVTPPRDLPPYLQELYRHPLLEPEQEREIFRRYNYLKYKAHRLCQQLDVLEASDEQLDRIESLLSRAEQVKNDILRANLRLVVSIARRHVGRSPQFFEIVSDGNLALMRAVEKFDYARGYKFSTYASWAVMRNYARTIPEQMYQSARLVTGVDEMLASAPDRSVEARESVVEAARHLVAKGLALLTERERDVVVRHYGIGQNGQGMTLDQIGQMFGVTKERVRQIERRALNKIRASLGEDHAHFVAD